jgi:hypothetical protein
MMNEAEWRRRCLVDGLAETGSEVAVAAVAAVEEEVEEQGRRELRLVEADDENAGWRTRSAAHIADTAAQAAADGEAGGDMAANVGTGADRMEVKALQPEAADGGIGHNRGRIGYWEVLKGKAHHAVSWEAAWAAARAASQETA